MKRKIQILVMTCIALLLAQTAARAVGALYTRPLNSSQTYNKAWIKTVDATVQIDGQVATTHVDQLFRNEMSTTVEAVWIFPLPSGAVVTELYYWFNGVRYKGSIREAQAARQDYESHIRQQIDPALLEYLGDNLFKLSIAPINPNSDVRSEITYVQLLDYEFGNVDYTFLLNAVGLSPKPLNRVSISGTVESPAEFKYLRSPSHGAGTAFQLTRVSDRKYTFLFGDENFTPNRDLQIEFETLRKQVEVNLFRYTPTPEDSIGSDSFYAVWITPPDSIDTAAQIPKNIVFTADVSSSMEGTRIQQLKASLNAFLNNLAPIDYFNMVTFGTTVVKFRSDLVEASAANLDAARAFITEIGAVGLTNIDEALKVSLQQSFGAATANYIIFLTDGYPTWGETDVPDILANVKSRNTKGINIFPFGVGEEVSKPLLLQMAVENGGYATFIASATDITTTINNHFKRISKPVLGDLAITIEGLIASDRYPRPLPDLFWGSQVLQLGLYRNSGDFPVTLTGTMRDKSVQLQDVAACAGTPGGYAFVPRLWAQAKIRYLLEQIGIYGEKAELKNQVIELSLKFQILTPYTSFYSDPNPPNTAVEERPVEQPAAFTLHQNYPNPFNPATTIRYDLLGAGSVTVRVYDLQGRLVRVLFSGARGAGSYMVSWDGTDLKGIPVAAGIYICRMEFIDGSGRKFSQSRRMLFVK
ncbi:MAG TPA: VIT domain-containing protein [bacterium]|nr:VIT domain-containing protein [bacterium]HPR89296.1 VIT domain-containing protein [bacterium]